MNRDNAKIGAAYEEHVAEWVTRLGGKIIGRGFRHASDVEFDIYAEMPGTGERVGIECKASENDADQPGMVRSDNRWKVYGYVMLLNLWRERTGDTQRYIVVTSHMPKPGSAQRSHLDEMELRGYLQVVEVPWDGIN